MYSTNKRITAVILLCSQLLTITSCSNYSNIPTQPKIAPIEKKVTKKHSKDGLVIPLVDSLMVTNADGQKLNLKYDSQRWQAELITEDGAKQVLPIMFDPDYSISDLINASKEEQRQLVHLVVSGKGTLDSTYVYVGKETYTGQTVTNQVQTKSSTEFSYDAVRSSKMLIPSTAPTRTSILPLSKRVRKEQKLVSKQGNSIIVNPPVDNTKQAIKRASPVSIFYKQHSISSPSIKPTYKDQQPKNNSPSVTLSERKALELHKKVAQDKREQVKPYNQVDIDASITDSNGITEQLIEEQAGHSYIAKGGHQVSLEFIEGKWMAIIKENAPVGFSRTHYFELYLAPGFTINELSKHSSKWQESHIAVVFPEHSKNSKGYVYIGEGGLLGGGNSGSKGGGGKDNDRSSGGSSKSSGGDKSKSSGSSKSSSSSSGSTRHDKESSQSTSRSTTSSAGTYNSSSFKPSTEQRATAAMLSSIGIKSELPTYHFPKSYTNDYSYSTPHVSYPNRDTSYSSSVMDSISSSRTSTVSTPTPIISYRTVTSMGDIPSSSHTRDTSADRTTPSSSITGTAAYMKTPSEGEKGFPLTLKSAAKEIKSYVQAVQDSGQKDINSIIRQREKGEQLLTQLHTLKQQQERAHKYTEKAYITPDNSGIGDQILLEQLLQQEGGNVNLSQLESDVLQTLRPIGDKSDREMMEMVKKAMRDSEAATGKYVSKERDDKSKGKEKDDQSVSANKEAIKANLNVGTASSISSSSSASTSQPLPSTVIKGPLVKDIQDKKQKEKPSKDRLFWMHDHPIFTPSSTSTSTPNVSATEHTSTSSSSSTSTNSNAKSKVEIYNEWCDLLEEIQTKLGHAEIHNLADGICLQKQIKEYIAKIKSYEKHQSISRGSIEQALSQLKSLSVQVEDALDKERYNAVIDGIKQVLDTRMETINRIQDEEEDPAIIIATAQEIKPHVEAAIKRLVDFPTKQDKSSSIENLKEAKNQLEAIIRDYTHKDLLVKYKAAFGYAAEHVSKRIEQEQEELAKSIGKPVGKPEITITNKPGITIEQLEEIFPDGTSNNFNLQKLLDTLDITVNFPVAEETSSNPEEEASTEETKREEIRRGKEREKLEPEKGKKGKLEKPEDYDLPGGMHIPHLINLENGKTVKVTFGQSLIKTEGRSTGKYVSADRMVDRRLIPCLVQVLNTVSKTVKFSSIHISATTNGHGDSKVSNHRVENGARAIDISMIDGKYVQSLGPNHALVIAFQNAMDELPNIRENFGPYWLHKEKEIYSPKPLKRKQDLIDMHTHHIHFSINR